MSNYEIYVTQRKLLENAIEAINLSLGRNTNGEYNSHNDKHELSFSIVEMGYGYYGSSSYYRIDNDIAKKYLLIACKSLRSTIGDTAINTIKTEIDRLRRAAEVEAKEVLQNL